MLLGKSTNQKPTLGEDHKGGYCVGSEVLPALAYFVDVRRFRLVINEENSPSNW